LHNVALGHFAERFFAHICQCGACCPSCQSSARADLQQTQHLADRDGKLIMPLPGHPVKMSDLRPVPTPENAQHQARPEPLPARHPRRAAPHRRRSGQGEENLDGSTCCRAIRSSFRRIAWYRQLRVTAWGRSRSRYLPSRFSSPWPLRRRCGAARRGDAQVAVQAGPGVARSLGSGPV